MTSPTILTDEKIEASLKAAHLHSTPESRKDMRRALETFLASLPPAPTAGGPNVLNYGRDDWDYDAAIKLALQRAAPCPARLAAVAATEADQQTLDAQRYRWLRGECERHGGLTIASAGAFGLEPWSGDDPDRAIDAAMSQEPQQ
jgi:hypothetical protein